jgi:DNA primase
MNSNTAKSISLEKLLQKQGHSPTKINGDDYWYKSPFRLESTPSFKVNIKLNRWYDHGEQIGGNAIDFLIYKFGFTVSETLEYLKQFSNEIDAFSFQKQNFEIIKNEKNEINHINKSIPVNHTALVNYLKSRKINNYKNIEQLKEIHYTINDKNYFALGFKNNSQGWEIRSKYAKICLGK